MYAEALFDAAKQAGKLDTIRDQLAQFADALSENREMQLFFFSPYFSSNEKKEGLAKALDGADPELQNFLELLIEKHRMPVIFRARKIFDDLWAEENKRLAVTVTSAVELDPRARQAHRLRDREADGSDRRAAKQGGRRHPRRPGAPSGQHGPGCERPQPVGQTSKERRLVGVDRRHHAHGNQA